MKTVGQLLKHNFKKGPLSFYDSNGNERYWEDSKGYWHKKEYDYNNNRIYYEDSNGHIQDNRPKQLTKTNKMKTKRLFNLNCQFTGTFQLLPNIMGVKNEGIFIVLPFYGTIIIS